MQAAPRQWFAVPVGLQPQLACFDRAGAASPPATLTALLEESSRGQTFGLNLDTINGTWTLGSLGALEAFRLALKRRAAAPRADRPDQTWLGWLRTPISSSASPW